MDRIILNVKELSKYLNCSQSCTRKLRRESKIPFFKIGDKLLFDKNKINAWLSEKEVEPKNNRDMKGNK